MSIAPIVQLDTYAAAAYVEDPANAIKSTRLDDGVGPAFSSMDLRAFVLPTFSGYDDVFRFSYTALNKMNQNIDNMSKAEISHYLERSYVQNLAGVSCAAHTDKFAVTTLGRTNPAGFTHSTRTVAGSMVFWMGGMSPITELLMPKWRGKLLHADELPPFDLYLTFMNDFGDWSSAVIQGINIIDESYVVDVNSPSGITFQYSFMAMSRTPVAPGYFSLLPRIAVEDLSTTSKISAQGSFDKHGHKQPSLLQQRIALLGRYPADIYGPRNPKLAAAPQYTINSMPGQLEQTLAR